MSESRRGNMVARVLLLVRELLRGHTLDRHRVSKLLGMRLEAADRFLRDVARHWPELGKAREGGKRVVRWSPSNRVPDTVAVAACFGASLSRLFEGSNYDPGLRDARARLVANVRRPELFEHFDRKFYFVRAGGEMMLPDNAGILDDVVDAVLRRNHINIEYQRFGGRRERLRVKPLTIAVYRHQLYVVARDEEGQDHPYRFGRITSIEREDATFAYPSKSNYDPERLFADSLGVFVGSDYAVRDVTLRLDASWRDYVRHHRWHRSQTSEENDDHVLVHLRVRLCPELESWILGFGERAEVVAPKKLRIAIAKRTRAAARVYARKRPASRRRRR